MSTGQFGPGLIAAGLIVVGSAAVLFACGGSGAGFCETWQSYQGKAAEVAQSGDLRRGFELSAQMYAELQPVAPSDLEAPIELAHRAIERLLEDAPEADFGFEDTLALATDPEYMRAQLRIAQHAETSCGVESPGGSQLSDLDPDVLEAMAGLTKLLFDGEPADSTRAESGSRDGAEDPLDVQTAAAQQIAGGQACAAIETLHACSELESCRDLTRSARQLCPEP